MSVRRLYVVYVLTRWARRYRWQLEAFVDKVKGRTPSTWVSAEDTVANMVWVEKVYEKVCSSAIYRSSADGSW